MDINAFIASLPRSKKTDFLPGSVDQASTGKLCPSCGKEMAALKPCCGSPYGLYACKCGYKINKE